jgi:ankyrin repeat protein
LHVAIHCDGNVESIKKLLSKGANINHQNQQARTPLIVAVIKGLDDIVRLLVECQCRVDLQDMHGNTALHYSCMYNYDTIAELLIFFGASQTITNNEKQVPLETCVNPRMLNLFIKDHN